MRIVLEHEGRKWLEILAKFNPDSLTPSNEEIALKLKYIVCVMFETRAEREEFKQWIDDNISDFIVSPVNQQWSTMTVHFDSDKDFVKMKLYLSQFEPISTECGRTLRELC